MKQELQNLEKQIQYLASLNIMQLKQAYLYNNVKWVYIAELNKRKYISDQEMLFITGIWK